MRWWIGVALGILGGLGVAQAQTLQRTVNYRDKGWTVSMTLPTHPRFGIEERGYDFVDLTEMALAEKKVVILYQRTYFFEGHFWQPDPGFVVVTMLFNRPGPIGLKEAKAWWISGMAEYKRKPHQFQESETPTRTLGGREWAEVLGTESGEHSSPLGNRWMVYLLPLEDVGCLEVNVILYPHVPSFFEPTWKAKVQKLVDTMIQSLEVKEGPRRQPSGPGPGPTRP